MDLLTREEFVNLTQVKEENCISIYIPTHRAAPETEQDRIRLKNCLQQAERQLEEKGLTEPQIRKLLKPATELLNDQRFWQHQADGLAVFLAESEHHLFRLPGTFEECVRLTDHFYLNPLLSQFQARGKFYVLAVSQNSCRLLAGDRDQMTEVDEANLPEDMQSALGYWREANLNFHSMRQKPGNSGPTETAMYHGHEEETAEVDLKKYFGKIDEGVTEALKGEDAPLVFAGVEFLFPIYKDRNTYAKLIDEPLTGNPEETPDQKLHERAWSLVEPLFRQRDEEVLNRLHQLESEGKATAAINKIDVAARDGLVDTLLVSRNESLWGEFDESGKLIDTASRKDDRHSEDLLDRDVLFTLQNSGRVLALDAESMPDKRVMYAILRAPASTAVTS